VGANVGPRKCRRRFGDELGCRFLLVEFCRSRAQVVEAVTPGGAVGSDLLQRGDHVGHEAQLKVRQHDAAVFTEQNVLRFQIPVNNTESVQILQGYQDLGGKESDGLKEKAVAGLSVEEGVEVPAGAFPVPRWRRRFRWRRWSLPSKDMLVAALICLFLIFNYLFLKVK
jgi:hypothetical protein